MLTIVKRLVMKHEVKCVHVIKFSDEQVKVIKVEVTCEQLEMKKRVALDCVMKFEVMERLEVVAMEFLMKLEVMESLKRASV